MTEKLTIKWPKLLLEEARKAAKASGQSVDSFVLQGALERIQRQRAKSSPKVKSWPKERMKLDWAWIENHYDTLLKNHPDQWIIVHEKQVVGAHRQHEQAIREAEQVIGDIWRAHALVDFVEATRRVY
jgi:hypothetical protein